MIDNNEDWIILQQVYSHEEASDLEKLLLDHKILCKLVHETASFDPATGLSSEEKLTIQINRKDYDAARDVLLHELEIHSSTIEENHYLLEFTNEELLDLIQHEDEWSPDDVILARTILKQRNVSWNENEVFEKNEAIRDAADQPEKVPFINLLSGYIFAILGGLIGLLIGYYIYSLKKTDRYGNRVFYYDQASRNSAKIIFTIGAIWLFLEILIIVFILDY